MTCHQVISPSIIRKLCQKDLLTICQFFLPIRLKTKENNYLCMRKKVDKLIKG